MFQSCREHENMNLTFSNFLVAQSAIYEIRWKNNLEPSTSQMTIWRMRIALLDTLVYKHSLRI